MAAIKHDTDNTEVEDQTLELETQEEAAGALQYSLEEEKQAAWRLDVILIPLCVVYRKPALPLANISRLSAICLFLLYRPRKYRQCEDSWYD